MSLSYYAARANLSYLRDHHPDWSHAELAAALGYSVSWVKLQILSIYPSTQNRWVAISELEFFTLS